MAHSSAESAARLLGVFRKLNVKAGESLMDRLFSLDFSEDDWTHQDFENGLQETIVRRWVVLSKSPRVIVLTAAGAGEIASLDRK